MASPFFNSAADDEFDEEDLNYIAQSSRQGGGGGGAPKAKIYLWENARGGRCAQLAPRKVQLLKGRGDVGARTGAPNWSSRKNQNHPRPRALVVTAKKALVQLDQIP